MPAAAAAAGGGPPHGKPAVVEHGLVVFGYIYSVSACTREHCRRQLGVGQAVEDALEGVTGGDDGGRHRAVGG